MLRIYFTFCFAFFSIVVLSQSFVGAWEATTVGEDGKQIKNVVIFSEQYQVLTQHNAETGAFISSNGGSWKMVGKTVTEVVEFDTNNPERVGSEVSFEVWLTKDKMGIVGSDLEWSRIDAGTPGALRGAWLFSGRVKDGQKQLRDTDLPRKTMKIMSGTRFQWIAYNTETKKFMGTGGGTYTTQDGKYTEHIEFFSRDDTRVGASLDFNFELKEGNWHHSGLSSKGKPIHEIWTRRD